MKTAFPEILLMAAMAILLFCMLDIVHLSNAAAAIGAIALVAIGRLVVALEHRARRRRAAR